jgi:hypothetical protein
MDTLELNRVLSERARDGVFRAIREGLPAAAFKEAVRCSTRLVDALPRRDRLDRNLVLVAFGGGKDSAYTVAFVRAMQLVLFRTFGTTFRLRVVTNRHAGMPYAVMANIERVYQALGLPTDPDCELLLVDGNQVRPFDVDAPLPAELVRRNRLDILMAGHRTFADGRPTFCNACNFSVVNSFGLAASYGEGADLIVTGDSEREQRQYALWVGRLARQLNPGARPAAAGSAIGRLMTRVDQIAGVYFTDIHGADASAVAERRVTGVPDALQFFSIYADTDYAAGDHLETLTGFLGFEFDELAFSFTESDCGNPALMAHLRALKVERVFGRSYAEGLAEYVAFALDLMRKKDIPPQLVELMRLRYEGPEGPARMRRAADAYARETFGLAEEQLVCMAYSPFAEKGAGLAAFLDSEHPRLAGRCEDVRALLAGAGEDPELAADLQRLSGLELAQLRVLYRGSLRRPATPDPATPATPAAPGGDVIDTVLADDPHQAVIRTRHAPDGPDILERISGR